MNIIQNTLEFSDQFLWALVLWCCGRDNLDLDTRTITTIKFRNGHTRAYRGACWTTKNGGRFYIELGDSSRFPHTCTLHGVTTTTEDRIEGLVLVTAHELTHVKQHKMWWHARDTTPSGRNPRGLSQILEREGELRGGLVLELFKRNREALLTEWRRYGSNDPDWNIVQKKILTAAKDM